ncbi:flippase [Flavobacterium sp. LB1P62]|uniref:flippase n=1 Tax=unclassified Flavobacterium TaxID=196869 RepID=UPI003AAD1DDF
MFSFFNKVLYDKKHKILVSNFVYLAILQGLNVLLPLITFPYLVRVLGIENFGLLSFSFALITYFQIITDFGFNSIATRDISVAIEDKKMQQDIFNDVMSTKLFLLVLCFFLMSIIVFSFEIFSNHWELYFFSFGSVLGQAIFPVWFFQGMQKMRYITYLNIFTKIIFTIAIFTFVRQQEDYFLVPIFNASGIVIAGILSFYFVKKHFDLQLKLQSFQRIKNQLIKGKYVFLSELKISLFTNTNTLILGIFVGNQAVGYFSAAEKLARAIGNFQTPISNVLFPFLANEMISNKIQTIKKINKITRIGALFFSIIVLLGFFFAKEIITLVYGQAMNPAIILFKIVLIIPLASFLDTMFGKQILLNLGKDNLYFRVILWATVLNISINLGLTYFYEALGTAIALTVTQIFIVFGMWFYAKRETDKFC